MEDDSGSAPALIVLSFSRDDSTSGCSAGIESSFCEYGSPLSVSPSRRVGKSPESVVCSFAFETNTSTSHAPSLTDFCSSSVEPTTSRSCGCFCMSSCVMCDFLGGSTSSADDAARRSRASAAACLHLSTSRICLPRSGPIRTTPIDLEMYESVAIFWTSPRSYSSVRPWTVSLAWMSWRLEKLRWMFGDRSNEISLDSCFACVHDRMMAPLSSTSTPPVFLLVSRGLPLLNAA
mmetsp:Transcript_9708/g.25818  ORF Transcript_9708/g.25818 Transcript_9708/m.25818 type:complete len:234 (+) Transcript_9708:115-816(+)